MVSQAIVLGKKPHVIIATPGRLVDHLENTKGFNLRALKYLVCMYKILTLKIKFQNNSSRKSLLHIYWCTVNVISLIWSHLKSSHMLKIRISSLIVII